MNNPATVADAERKLFQNWYRTEAEAMPNVGAMMAWMARAAIAHAAPVGADVAAIPTWQERLVWGPLAHVDSECRAMVAEIADLRAALAGTPAETVKAGPVAYVWFYRGMASIHSEAALNALDDGKGTCIPLYAAPATAPDVAKDATFSPGHIVRKKSGSEWQGAIVGTYSSSITPEGYAVESSTHRGSVQIYPVSALELVTP